MNNNPLNWLDPWGLSCEKSNDNEKSLLEKLQEILIEVGKVMETKYPYSLNMDIYGTTANVAGSISMVGYIPKAIGYSNTNFWQGGRIAYKWANQYGSGIKSMTVVKLGLVSTGLAFLSAVMTGYTAGATINAYYWGYLNYKKKYEGK